MYVAQQQRGRTHVSAGMLHISRAKRAVHWHDVCQP